MSRIGPIETASFLVVAEKLGLPVPDFATAQKTFSFRRRKRNGVWGWATWFRIGPLTLGDMPWAPDIPFPRRRSVAVRWARDFAARHGFEAALDIPRKRPKLRLIQGGKR